MLQLTEVVKQVREENLVIGNTQRGVGACWLFVFIFVIVFIFLFVFVFGHRRYTVMACWLSVLWLYSSILTRLSIDTDTKTNTE